MIFLVLHSFFQTQCTARSAPAQKGLRMVFLSVFADGVFGISFQNSTDFGDFTPPTRVLQCARIVSSFSTSPSRSTTMAFTASPHFSPRPPSTAPSRQRRFAAASQSFWMIARGRRRDRRRIEKRHVHRRFGLPVGLAQARAENFNALFEFVRCDGRRGD